MENQQLTVTHHLLPAEANAIHAFREALPPEDQAALDDLLQDARDYLPPPGLLSHVLPIEVLLLSMLIQAQKRVMALAAHLPPSDRSLTR